MIKSLTPYYINTSFYSDILESICLRYRLKVRVWRGLKSDAPLDANYEITINNVTESSGNNKINLARLINDFIDFETVQSVSTNLVNSPNQMWVKTEVFYTGLNGIESNVPERQDIQLFVKGYGYGMDGENPSTPTNKILMNLTDYTMSNDGTFIVPIKLNEIQPPIPFLVISTVTKAGNEVTINFTKSGSFDSIDVIINTDTSNPESLTYTFSAVNTSPIVFTYLPTTPSELYIKGFDSSSSASVVSNTVAF